VSLVLRLATRGSPLATIQAEHVAERLRAIGVDAELVVVETEGDVRRDVALVELAGRGIFTKEVQAAVLEGRADVAVHSAKDLPPLSPDGLLLASVPERLDPADAIVGAPLSVLGPGATVATGAPRRRAMLLAARPDLDIVPLRGNIATRLDAVGREGVDAVLVAMAALLRLGLEDRAAERLDPIHFVPQVAQGAIALECRRDAEQVVEALESIDDRAAHRAIVAERSFLDALGAGCELPGGAIATVTEGSVSLRAALMTDDGGVVVRGSDDDADPIRVGRALAARLRRELERAAGAT
jgi:hydroxymethylbilane synthase